MNLRARVAIMVTAAVIVFALGVEALVAHRAGGAFARTLRSLDGADLGQPELQLRDVKVERGLVSSTATADLLVSAGPLPISVPLRFRSWQGLGLDGTTLRVNVRLGDVSEPQIRRLLADLNDRDPFFMRMRFGLDGRPAHAHLALSPVHAQLGAEGPRVDWDGARLDMRFAGVDDGTARTEGSLHSTPLRLDLPQPRSMRLELGAIDETFQQRGGRANSTYSFKLDMGPSVGTQAGQSVRIERVHAQSSVAYHGAAAAQRGNPSGLPAGRIALRDFELTLDVSQPKPARLAVSADVQAPYPEPLMPADADAEPDDEADIAYARAIRGNIQLRASSSLLDLLPPMVSRGLLDAGDLVREGDDVVSRVVFADGGITINGRELAD